MGKKREGTNIETTRLNNLSQEFALLDELKKSIALLGNEFTDTAISKEYFYKIFNEIDNYVFITDTAGNIEDYNKKKELDQYALSNIKKILVIPQKFLQNQLKTCVTQNTTVSCEAYLKLKNTTLPVAVKFSPLQNLDKQQIIVTCSDLTKIKAKEKESLEQIILSQERERNRVAQRLAR